MIQEKKIMYCKSLVELNEIIKHMSLELQNKIPQEIKQEFIKNMDKEYHFTYDKTVSLEEQKIMPETQGLLSAIYSNYLCSEEEKKKWKEYDNFYKQEQNKQGNIEVKEMFSKNMQEKNANKVQTETKQLAIVKEKNIFRKILDKLKSWFLKK